MPGSISTGSCTAGGLGEASSARGMGPDSIAASQQDGRATTRQGSGTSGTGELGSFCTTGMKSFPPPNRAVELLQRRFHTRTGGNAAPATYRNIKVLLSRRVNSSNALSKGQINTIWEHLRSLGSHIFSQAGR